MSLLQEIQDAAVDSGSDLSSVLRKCKVLASRLNSKPLEDWLVWECNGYLGAPEVPDYRIWGLELKGNFTGAFHAAINNAPIPMLCVPEELQTTLGEFHCRMSVTGIADTISRNQRGNLTVSVGDLAVLLGTNVYQGYNCVQAWGEFGSGHLVEVLNTVRNRILDFVLALEKEEPNAGEIGYAASGDLATRLPQMISLTIYGGTNYMGDSYQAGQAGAMGPGAHSHDMTFQQFWTQSASGIDLPTLASQLSRLQSALRDEATSPEHQIAIGNVAAAQQAAANGDGPAALRYLKAGGKWALGVAEKVGVGVAIAALKFSLGI